MAGKKKIGRPRGARNKAKPRPLAAMPFAAPVAPVAPVMATPSAIGSLAYHERQRSQLQELFDALRSDPSALPKDLTSYDAGIARHSRAISELSGETRLTEQKIVQSEAWRVDVLPKIARVLSAFPDAMIALVKAFESGE